MSTAAENLAGGAQDAGAAAAAAGGKPGAGGAGGAAAQGGAAGGNQPPVTLEWLGDAPPELHDFAGKNGWKTPADAVANFRELQTFLGADKAGRGLVLPKEGDAEAWGKFWDKLGRPGDATGYGLDRLEGADPGFAKSAATAFHAAGLTGEQAKALAGWWGEQQKALIEQKEQAYQQKADSEIQELRAEWGAATPAYEVIARRGARQFGFTPAELDQIERAIGTKAMMQRFLEVGKKLAEDVVPNREDGSEQLGAGAAKAQITARQADKEFMAKVMAGEPGARAEWDRLFKVAYGS